MIYTYTTNSNINDKDSTTEQANKTAEKTTSGAKTGRKRGAESSNDREVCNDYDDDESVGWEEVIEIDELIDDAREYDDFNTQVGEEIAMYKDDEMIDDCDKVETEVCSVTEVMNVCGSKQASRTIKCPGQKRRIVTVTQWDASARKQMIQQLGQRGVT